MKMKSGNTEGLMPYAFFQGFDRFPTWLAIDYSRAGWAGYRPQKSLVAHQMRNDRNSPFKKEK